MQVLLIGLAGLYLFELKLLETTRDKSTSSRRHVTVQTITPRDGVNTPNHRSNFSWFVIVRPKTRPYNAEKCGPLRSRHLKWKYHYPFSNGAGGEPHPQNVKNFPGNFMIELSNHTLGMSSLRKFQFLHHDITNFKMGNHYERSNVAVSPVEEWISAVSHFCFETLHPDFVASVILTSTAMVFQWSPRTFFDERKLQLTKVNPLCQKLCPPLPFCETEHSERGWLRLNWSTSYNYCTGWVLRKLDCHDNYHSSWHKMSWCFWVSRQVRSCAIATDEKIR